GALASMLQTEEGRKVIQTQLIADIANHYFMLLAMDQQLVILEQTLINSKTDVQAMKALKTANIVTGAAEVQSEASMYAAEIAIPRLKKQIRELENGLNGLLAKPSGPVKRTSFKEQKLMVDLKSGIPIQLL